MNGHKTQILIEFVSTKTDDEIQAVVNQILDNYFFNMEVKNFQVSKREVMRPPT
jgi:predicted nucleic-acid-binding protein